MAEWISAFALLCSILGIGLLLIQIRRASDTAKISLLFAINRDLNAYADVAEMIESHHEGNWVRTLEIKKRERLLDYISYFEGIQLSLARHLFKIEEVNAFFANRFFRLANNISIREEVFLNKNLYSDAFQPIFILHASLSVYRDRKGLPTLFGGSPLKSEP